jgi:hypothetical protein
MTTSLPKITVRCRRLAGAAIRQCGGLGLLVLLFALVIVFVNPVREMMFGDDWAYGLTVRHLLTTGQYKLHDWATANMPVQVYLAALLAHIFGYSFTVLHCSTLIVFLIGLIASYFLLRDFGVGEIEATLLTVVVLSAPLVLLLSFTFQTDAQFLGWNMLAFCRYRHASVRGSVDSRLGRNIPFT